MSTVLSTHKATDHNEEGLILVVDDEPDIRSIIALHASGIGLKAIEAGDGREALELLTTCEVDVIVSDMVMPKMSGYEILQEVRRRGLATPFIGLSGFREKKIILECLQFDLFDYLDKPFDAGSLKRLLKEALHMARAQRRLSGTVGNGEGSLASGSSLPASNELLSQRLALLSEQGKSARLVRVRKDYAAYAPAERRRLLFVDEAIRQLAHSEKALRSLSERDDVHWELGYLGRVMTFLESAAEVSKEKDILRLVEAIRDTVAVYRVRRRLMHPLQLKILRNAHKLLMLCVTAMGEPSPEDGEEERATFSRELNNCLRRLRETHMK